VNTLDNRPPNRISNAIANIIGGLILIALGLLSTPGYFLVRSSDEAIVMGFVLSISTGSGIICFYSGIISLVKRQYLSIAENSPWQIILLAGFVVLIQTIFIWVTIENIQGNRVPSDSTLRHIAIPGTVAIGYFVVAFISFRKRYYGDHEV